MRCNIAGLHAGGQGAESGLDGLFLCRVQRAWYRGHAHKPYVEFRFSVIEPVGHRSQDFLGRLYCTKKALWKLRWFLRDFGYDADLLQRDQVDERGLTGLQGVVRTSYKIINGNTCQDLTAFAPAVDWEALSHKSVAQPETRMQQGSDNGL